MFVWSFDNIMNENDKKLICYCGYELRKYVESRQNMQCQHCFNEIDIGQQYNSNDCIKMDTFWHYIWVL